MDLTPTPEERAFRERARQWLAEHVPAAFTGAPTKDDPGYVEYLRDWQRSLKDAGWMGLTWPVEYGGGGYGPIEEAIFLEEMARANAPPILGLVGVALIGPTIAAHGTHAQKQRYLAPMLSGDEVWCQGYSEPNAGSDLGSLATQAVLEGDTFVVNGQKVWTSLAHIADFCFALVRTDAEAPKYRGISCLLVDMKSPGITVRPLRMMSGDSDFTEVFFSDVRVPVSQLLGEVNGGWHVGMTALSHERAGLGGGVLVAASRFLDQLIDAARRLPRPGGVAASDPLVRQKLAAICVDLEVYRLTAARALARVAHGGTPGPEASILKIFWSEMNQRAAQAAMEILGPHAQLTGGPQGDLVHFYLRTRGNTIEGGTSEVLRNTVAQRVLGLPKSY